MNDVFFVHFICKSTKENFMCLVEGTENLALLMEEYDKENYILLNIQYIGLTCLKEIEFFRKTEESLVIGTEKEK